MQFALNQFKQRIKPAPKIIGFCPSCGSPLIPKCGQILCWHWSHKTLDCDPWYEPESEWHRNWKNLFPDDWQEVTIGNHRADIKTPHGVVEFQASSISSTEVQEREDFYRKMIWVVKADTFNLEPQLSSIARSFFDRFRYPYLSHPMEKELGSGNLFDLLAKESYEEKEKLMSTEEYNAITKEVDASREILRIKNEAARNKAWLKDPMYQWRWPRTTWGFAKKKIYLDLGDQLFCIAWMSSNCKFIKGMPLDKEKFVAKLLS
jgi:competence CoiA-like predicted nuclease